MSPRDTTVLWDFDNTLFQTRRFWKEKLFTAFTDLGISYEEAERGFKLATAAGTGKRDHFVPDVVVQCIAEVSGQDSARLTPILESVVYTDLGKSYFFEGALKSVHTAKERGYKGYLLSYGDEPFKRRWFSSIGLGDYFAPGETVITNQKKPAIVGNLALTKTVVMVNDVLEETLAVMDVLRAAGHDTLAYHFAENPDTLPPQTDAVVPFTQFNELLKAL